MLTCCNSNHRMANRGQILERPPAATAAPRNRTDERRGIENLLPQRSLGGRIAPHGEQVRRPAGPPERVRTGGRCDGEQRTGIWCEFANVAGRAECAGVLPGQLSIDVEGTGGWRNFAKHAILQFLASKQCVSVLVFARGYRDGGNRHVWRNLRGVPTFTCGCLLRLAGEWN